jgi:hypothetical protein
MESRPSPFWAGAQRHPGNSGGARPLLPAGHARQRGGAAGGRLIRFYSLALPEPRQAACLRSPVTIHIGGLKRRQKPGVRPLARNNPVYQDGGSGGSVFSNPPLSR